MAIAVRGGLCKSLFFRIQDILSWRTEDNSIAIEEAVDLVTIAAYVAFLVRACFKGVLDTIALLSRG